ncbi:RNA polymerase sigma factor [Pedobacter nyackensis]|uniref:RNA polymerase sigma factor n=1 Tax=Pedobacter nyackensis TaxID=475255 RepID=UPI00292ED6D5|nr:sigma-70 family RNA polymerase sigma factor [Pedobacter nyackensis]
MTTYGSYTDKELMVLLKAGNKLGFTELYDRYHDSICRFVVKYLKSAELADDICQNVFLKIWEQREQSTQILEFGAYAFTIAKRQSLDFLKRAAVEQTAMSVVLNDYKPLLNSIEDNHQTNEYMAFIEKVLSELPEQTQRVFHLCRQENKSYDEAAEILGISRHAIKKHMVRSMRVLKDAAEGEMGVTLSVLLAVISSKL